MADYLVWCPERGQERCDARRIPSSVVGVGNA